MQLLYRRKKEVVVAVLIMLVLSNLMLFNIKIQLNINFLNKSISTYFYFDILKYMTDDNGNIIKGAGILIVEHYNDIPVLLLLSGKNKEYDEPGGTLDEGETPEQTACRECREETCNLINIKPDELDIIVSKIYRAYLNSYIEYIIYVKDININDFYHNAKLVFKNCADYHWKEKFRITRVPISNAYESIDNKLNITYDINNKPIMMRDRVIAILKTAKNILLNIHLSNPVPMYRNITQNNKMKCLIGTYTYTYHQYLPTKIQSIPKIMKPRNHNYAIYIIPNFTPEQKKLLKKCNDINIYILLVGFSNKHPPLKINLEYLSSLGKTNWKIKNEKINIKNNIMYLKSNTLDNFARILASNNFQKIGGPIYSKNDWVISVLCDITDDIFKILKNVTWSLTIVKEQPNVKHIITEKYPMNMN